MTTGTFRSSAENISIAPGTSTALTAVAADESHAPSGSSPSRSPSNRSPTSATVLPASSSGAHRFSFTTWLTSPRTSHSEHGVGCPHWSGAIACTCSTTARASFALQFVPFLAFICGGSFGLWFSLTPKNPRRKPSIM